NSFGTGAGRVENDLGKALPLLGKLLNRGGKMSADPADVGDAVQLSAALAGIYGLAIAFNRGDFFLQLGGGERGVASAGIKFKQPIVFVKAAGRNKFPEKLAVAFGIDLSENITLDLEADSIIAPNRNYRLSPFFAPVCGVEDKSVDAVGFVDKTFAGGI